MSDFDFSNRDGDSFRIGACRSLLSRVTRGKFLVDDSFIELAMRPLAVDRVIYGLGASALVIAAVAAITISYIRGGASYCAGRRRYALTVGCLPRQRGGAQRIGDETSIAMLQSRGLSARGHGLDRCR